MKITIQKIIILFKGFVFLMPFSIFAQNWTNVGLGVNNNIEGLYSDTINNRLYIAGPFTDTSCTNGQCYNFAYWDGNTINYIGDSLQTYGRRPLVKFNGDLIAPNFKPNSSSNPNYLYLAKWTGAFWSRTDSVHGQINNLRVIGKRLYAAGFFDTICGIKANNVAYKDSLGWHGIPDTVTWQHNNGLHDVMEYNGAIYVAGGILSKYGGIGGIAKWDGNKWSNVGGWSCTNSGWTMPYRMCIYKNELYVTGFYFFQSSGDPGNGICKWNDTIWSSLGTGLIDSLGGSAQANDMQVINGKLVLAGGFDFAGGIPAKNIAEWDGTKFCAFGGWFDAPIDHIANYNNQIFVADPWHANTLNINRLGRWMGGNYRDSCGLTNIGINQISNSSFIFIYPNPASDFISLKFENIFGIENLIVSIQNTLGQSIKKLPTSNLLDVSDLLPGCYFIEVTFPDKRNYRGKFIKE